MKLRERRASSSCMRRDVVVILRSEEEMQRSVMLVHNPVQSFLRSMPVPWNKMTLKNKLVMLRTVVVVWHRCYVSKPQS